MKKRIEFSGTIVYKNDSFTIKYKDKDWKDRLERFKSYYGDGRKIHTTVEIVDTPEYYLHKYYRGYLLPAVANAYGEMDRQYVHVFMLKKRFLHVPVTDENISLVPARFRTARCVWIAETRIMENGEVRDFLSGAIPSTADLTHDEFKEFIEKVEHVLFVEIGGHLGRSGQEEAAEYRRVGMAGSTAEDVQDAFLGDDVTEEVEEFDVVRAGNDPEFFE